MSEQSANILLLTWDSCRFDSVINAKTPILDSWCRVRKARTPATFTYPAHHAFFSGILPVTDEFEPFYNRFNRQLFALGQVYDQGHQKGYYNLVVQSDENVIDGFQKLGYKTIGTGAMNWFKQTPLQRGFESFKFTGTDADAQIDFLCSELPDNQPFFGFINFGETHSPFTYKGKPEPGPTDIIVRRMKWPPRDSGSEKVGVNHPSYRHQVEAVEFLDRKLSTLFSKVPANTLVVLCGDHGECFGEDGYFGHGVNHEKVFEVPIAIFRLDGRPIE